MRSYQDVKMILQKAGASRDILLLDIALDGYFRLSIERSDLGALRCVLGGCVLDVHQFKQQELKVYSFSSRSGDDLIALVTLVLTDASITTENEDFGLASTFWRRVNEAPGRWGADWARRALAASDFTAISLQDYAHRIVRCGIEHRASDRLKTSWVGIVWTHPEHISTIPTTYPSRAFA